MAARWKLRTLSLHKIMIAARPAALTLRYADGSMDGETFQVQGVRQVERNCEIGTDRYRVRFVGLPGAANANWLCGALMSASVTVWKNGRQVLDRDFDDNPCRPHIEGIQRVVFRRGQPLPEITAAPR